MQQCETIKKLLCSFYSRLKIMLHSFKDICCSCPLFSHWEVIVTCQVITSLITRAISAMIDSQHAKTKTRRKNKDAKLTIQNKCQGCDLVGRSVVQQSRAETFLVRAHHRESIHSVSLVFFSFKFSFSLSVLILTWL